MNSIPHIINVPISNIFARKKKTLRTGREIRVRTEYGIRIQFQTLKII